MATSSSIREIPLTQDPALALETARPPLLVRLTHWTFALSFFGLVISGFAIILAHPHWYWGETGGIGTKPLFSLPLPTMLGGPSGWGRYMHFQSAWIAVLSGLLYVVSGVLSKHFSRELAPAPRDLSWRSLRASIADHLHPTRAAHDESYNVLQRLSYLGVVFVLFPAIIFTGFAMSPSITSVFPRMVEIFGGHQTARTLHFFLSDLLVLFFAVHIVMITAAGFWARVSAMIVGRRRALELAAKESR
jgi:thiosulfate reductase cytochrome b subunit